MKEMTMDEIRSHLERITLPYVKTALEQEHQIFLANPKEVKKFKKVVKQMFSGGLLLTGKSSPKDRRLVRNLVKNPILPPDEEEINRTNELTAKVMSASWLGVLYLALKNRKDILLNECLLPQKIDEVNDEIWKALESSFNSLPITFEQGKEIMRQFASEVVLPCGAIGIPGGDILIEVASDEPPTFLARHKS